MPRIGPFPVSMSPANLLLDSLEDVREALRILRDVEGGRYRVSQQAGDTVYWSHRSRLRSGKAYAKGPHLDYQMRKNREYGGREYQLSDVQLANRLLRLELKLGAQLLREDRLGKAWHELTSGDLYEQWNDYFGRMIGDSEMMKDADLKKKVIEAAPTEGQGKAAYGCWTLIKSEGWERAKDMCTKRTWYPQSEDSTGCGPRGMRTFLPVAWWSFGGGSWMPSSSSPGTN